jgi:putative DNA primase/helicase
VDDAGVEAALYKFLATASRPARGGIAPFQPDKKKVGDVMHALRSLVYVAGTLAPPCWLDGRREGERFLACRNGLLRLRDEALLPHDPEYFNTSAVGFDYEADPPEPVEWLKFLRSVWPGASEDDRASILAVQEQYGYALSGDRRRQKIILHVGPKRAGKGVILRTLLKLMGNDAHVGLSLSGLATERFALEPLIGKQLAAVPDARSVGRSGQVVELLLAVSGGDELTVPRKYRTAVTVQLNCLFWMLSNVVPRLLDASGTIASRFIVVQYRNSFYGHEDLDLERRLDKELPGILKWAVKLSGVRAAGTLHAAGERVARRASDAVVVQHDH